VDRIRVALVITELDVGGAERCLVNLATRLERQRFTPVVYALAGPPSDDELVNQLNAAHVPVHFLSARGWWHFPSAKARLRSLLAEQAPHVVQTFLFHANVLGAVAGLEARVPEIVLGVRVADPSRWRRWVESRVARRVSRVVCVSRSVADYVREMANMPPEKLAVIPNGIDFSAGPTPAADLGRFGIASDRKVLAFVGRLHPQKGLDWLLPRLPPAFAQLPNHDLLVIGDGPQRSRLARQAGSLGIANRIHFVGRQGDVAALLRSSSLLVLPSRWEGMPNVVLEAMAAGLPVVSTDAAGVEELLGDAAPEQMAAQGDSDGFMRRLLRLAKDERLSSALGQRNRRRAEQHFSLSEVVARYAALYESLLRGDAEVGKNFGI
jgi:glycosyltransferase involved in cell wall biosynthesis